jgi:hypothetical protein
MDEIRLKSVHKKSGGFVGKLTINMTRNSLLMSNRRLIFFVLILKNILKTYIFLPIQENERCYLVESSAKLVFEAVS